MSLDSMKEIFDRMEQEGKPFWEIVLSHKYRSDFYIVIYLFNAVCAIFSRLKYSYSESRFLETGIFISRQERRAFITSCAFIRALFVSS